MVGLAPTFVNLLHLIAQDTPVCRLRCADSAWLVISRALVILTRVASRLIHLLEAALRVCSVSYQH